MLLTVTPNLCIERTIEIPGFRAGAAHRVAPENLSVNSGGKGINAARVAAQLGAKVLATSWVGRNQRAWFETELARESIAHDLVEVESDTRVCVNVVSGGGVKTEIVEAGNELSATDGTRMLEKFESLSPYAELVAICGSYPPEGKGARWPVLGDHLTSLCGTALKHNKKILVDGKGDAFKALLNSNFLPWAIKPNCEEAGAFLNYSVCDESSERRAINDFLKLGIEVVVLSCGARGAYLGTHTHTWFFTPPRVQEISAVGSGDALVGAFCAKVLEAKDAAANSDLVEAVRWGVAAGAANAAQARSAFCTRAEIEILVPQVQCREVK